MKMSLVVIQGKMVGEVIPVRGAEFSIGRDPRCDLHLPNPFVSRWHAKLTVKEGKVWLEDMGSRNGTFLNGQMVKRECEVKTNDWLRVGNNEYWVHLSPASGPKRSQSIHDDTAVLNPVELSLSPWPGSSI